MFAEPNPGLTSGKFLEWVPDISLAFQRVIDFSHPSDKLRSLRLDLVGLSKTKRSGNGEVSDGGHNYCYSPADFNRHM